MGISTKLRPLLKKRYEEPRFRLPKPIMGKYVVSVQKMETVKGVCYFLLFPYPDNQKMFEGIALNDNEFRQIYYGSTIKLSVLTVLKKATIEETLTFLLRYCKDCDLDLYNDFIITSSKSGIKTVIDNQQLKRFDKIYTIGEYYG